MTSGRKRPDLKIASDAKQDRADDLLGAVVPSRARDIPAASLPPEADLSNVVTFTPRNRKGEAETPPLEVAVADRPAPQVHSRDRQRQIALLIGGSLLIHGAIFAAFNREPEPHASIGMIVVSAEIVLGAHNNAGTSPTPSESEAVDRHYSPPTDQPTDAKPEAARKDIAKTPVEEPKEEAKQEKAETASKAEEALSVEKPPVPKEQAELVVQDKPAEKPKLTIDEKKPEAKEAKKVREAARHAKDDGENKRDRAAPASNPSVGANSIGRGRSDLDTNYRGIVAAHLARYKQFPTDAARGDQGVALVNFHIGSNGSVTSVTLVRGSGVPSLDQGALAWVRRASPFPAPPTGRAEKFTVPLRFARP
jgi:periplasmic protein TonB